MSESPQGQSKQNVPLKLAAFYIAVTIYVFIAIGVMQLQSGSLGLIMLVPVFIGVVISVLRTPRDTWTRIADAQKKHEQTTVGRIMHFAEIGILLYLAANGLLWLYKHY